MENCCGHRVKVRPEEEKRKIISRLNRIAGQVNGVRKMVEENRYCDDILTQLAAIEKSVKSLSAVIFERHMHTCLVEDVRAGDLAVVDEVVELFKRFR